MMPNTELASELLNEIHELKNHLFQRDRAIAAIEAWYKVAGPISRGTLEKVLEILKENR